MRTTEYQKEGTSNSRFALPHKSSHVLWHAWRTAVGACSAGASALDTQQLLSSSMASTCTQHPSRRKWHFAVRGCFAGTEGRQIFPLWTYWGPWEALHVDTLLSQGPLRRSLRPTSGLTPWPLSTLRSHKPLYLVPRRGDIYISSSSQKMTTCKIGEAV